MHSKDIKRQIREQLKSNYPNWRSLRYKEKKVIAKKVLKEAIRTYDFTQQVDAPIEKLLCIEEQMPTTGIMNLEAMARFIENHNNSILYKINKRQDDIYNRDRELRFIDDLLGEQIINKLLSYNGSTPSMREFFPNNFLRAELLKAIKYPEISYRMLVIS